MCANGHHQSHPMCFICHPTSTKDSYLEQAASKLIESKTPTASEAFSKLTLEDQSAPKVEEINKMATCMQAFNSIVVVEMEERETPALSLNNDLRQMQWLELQQLLQRLERVAIAHKMMVRVDGGVMFSSNFINSFKRLENKTLDPMSLIEELSRRVVNVSLTPDQQRIYLDEVKRPMERRANYGDGFWFGPILFQRFKRVKKKIPFAFGQNSCGESRRIRRNDIKRR
ncbi:uncharacterized protein LOC120274143 [Dioscorea cayenensis subsp. rotundata]|uniref:Uncharacterized protein LOC120274143 n=1 Tax=Dioscorea cayennensis subsp. rotundata TaxID=55577 RepID=A0AB40CAC9_DIOCR|nr:uncharacterized protein LOC120274143 [Dioscorea cayenensis subsp. rotundata]